MFCIALFGQSNSICKLPINWSETDSAMELDSSEMYIPNFMCMNDSSIVLSYPSCFEAISYEITNKAYGIVKRNTFIERTNNINIQSHSWCIYTENTDKPAEYRFKMFTDWSY